MKENNIYPAQEIDERFKTLINNAQAARVVSQAVEATIGPLGLDTMMVDAFGDVIITNDGVTILRLMEINHPAARMIINAARAQQEEVGDGTTTATIIAAALVAEGTAQVLRGVPVARVLEGISLGVEAAVREVRLRSLPAADIGEEGLLRVAMVAGRGHCELAELVTAAVPMVGTGKMLEPGFKFAESVIALEGASSELLQGVVVNREPLNRDMPVMVKEACIFTLDDALKPEEMENEALSTESGFRRYLELEEAFRGNLKKLADIGVNVILADRNVDSLAEEILTETGVLVIQRVSRLDMERVCEHTGARLVKRAALSRSPQGLARSLGRARSVEYREDLEHIRVIGGRGKSMATVLVGASTGEVVEERERMARDAAAAVQAAIKGGVVSGGGAIEVWTAAVMEKLAREARGMSSYGILCVKEALERPFACIMSNAGFNPLEKLVEAAAAQQRGGADWTIDCDSGQPVPASEAGIWDPTLVKVQALQTAGEVASAILRINTVIKKREAVSEER